jgi:subtilisin
MANKRLGTAAALFLAAAAVVPLGSNGAAAAPPDDVVPGAWIVTVAPGISPDEVAADHGRRLGAAVSHVYGRVARGYAAQMSSAAAARAAADPRVRTVVPDRYVRISAKPGGGGGGGGGQSVPTGVRRVGAAKTVDKVTTFKGAGVAVAVVDTGIDLDHPDLNVAQYGKNCSSGSTYDDGNGHGTHVAGTIGARSDNNTGVVGVAPGTEVVPVRVLNNAGSGTWSSIICGVDWVTDSGIKVANMSLGGTGGPGSCTDGGLRQAICESVAAGVTYVVAAGNENDDARNHVPASFPEVITVSALADSDGVAGGGTWRATCRSDQEDTLADFSNDGPVVDIIAPGVCINSTWKGGGYKAISGTSMASPHVAAAAALWVASGRDSTPAAVEAGLVSLGGHDWDDRDDYDGVKERLLHVDTL